MRRPGRAGYLDHRRTNPAVGYPETETKEPDMPRYLVEREFDQGLHIPVNEEGAKVCRNVIDLNLTDGVTWVHSYVRTDDNKKSFCIYDGPNPEAIRRAAGKTRLPVNKITEVRVLDPYFYR
jgi:hypothetical protein